MNKHTNEEIIFNVEPGLNYHVVTLQLAMPSNAVLVHPMADKLYTSCIHNGLEQWGSHDLVDIGLEALLGLHALPFEITCQSHQLANGLLKGRELPNHVVRGLSLADGSVQLDLAFERWGQLHGLVVIAEGDLTQKVRDLQRIQNELPRRLWLRIAVLSPHNAVLVRARQAGFLAINSGTQQGSNLLWDWLQRKVPPPGWPDFQRTQVKAHLDKVQGTRGDGPPLAVCLGTDPSSTLISLCTHKPQKAWICYDASTPDVEKVALRLKFCIDKLPVGHVEFVRTNFLGRGIFDVINKGIQNLGGPVRVDITPGTKSQGCALARIPGVEVWSLHGDVGEARCLSNIGHAPLVLQAPDILTQAFVSGGVLLAGGGAGRDASNLQGQEDFLALLARFLAHYVEEQRCKSITLNNLSCSHGSLQRKDGYIEVRFNSETKRGTLRSSGGYWFERVVASAFKAVGADEVRYGIKWRWTSNLPIRGLIGQSQRHSGRLNRTVSEPHMTEVDVLVRFKHRFVAVSCKSGKRPTTAVAKREIEAVAKSMGRFCIPVLIRPLLSDQRVDESLKAPKGAALLDLRYIADPQKLEGALQRKFAVFRG
jgi:hypothetical protein